MEWVIGNWAYISIVILVLDKVVALTPTDKDDLIWTGIKSFINVVFGKRK